MTNRPLTFNDYIGQDRIKQQLRITIGASKRNARQLPHMLMSGPPGLGKTTIAQVIANEMGVKLHEVMASNINSAEDLESVLAQLDQSGEQDVLFIDEIHRLPVKIEELLYPVMEDFIFEAEGQRFWVPRFTLIGATTLAGDLSRPLRDRFGIQFNMVNYSADETANILQKLAERKDVLYTDEALLNIAKRSKGVARIAINYFNRCQEFADFSGDGIIDDGVVNDQFDILGIDEIGLDQRDYDVLEYLATLTSPIGLDALATAVNMDKGTIANVVEPYLIQKRLVNRTSRGRQISEEGLNWIYRNNKETFERQSEQVGNNIRLNRNGENLPIIGSRA